MTASVFILLALAGGLGSCARLMVDGLIRSLTTADSLWATIAVNLTGSLALGLLTGLVGSHILPESWQIVVGTGFLGGYTTFSTASFEIVRLIQRGRLTLAAVVSLGVLTGATALAGVGIWLGSAR